jgi:hypothetical protein
LHALLVGEKRKRIASTLSSDFLHDLSVLAIELSQSSTENVSAKAANMV